MLHLLVDSTENFLDKIGYDVKLKEIEFGIKELKKKHQFTKENVEKLIQDVVLHDKRVELEKKTELGKTIRERKQNSIKNYLIQFVEKMENGEARAYHGERYSDRTIVSWRQFRRIFLEFYDTCPFTWDDIDQSIVNRFLTHLENGDYMRTVINKYMKNFKQIITDAEKLGIHSNQRAKHQFKRITIKESDKVKEVYLTVDELQALYDMELHGFEEKVRDLFLVGVFTAQRFSDYSVINKHCIGETARGCKVIRMEQEKTDNKIVIPIMDDKLEILLKKYDYNVPKITDQNMNRDIKKICGRLSKTVPSLSVLERTLLKKQEKIAEENGTRTFKRDETGHVVKYKWELVSTHTCRRTAITNMYLSRKYTLQQMMSVSGHKTERQFYDYIKLSLDEIAEDIAKISSDGMF